MKETNYINDLENTIANYKGLIIEIKSVKEKLVNLEEVFILIDYYCKKIEEYCEYNNIDSNTIITNECIEYLKKDTDTVKDNCGYFLYLKNIKQSYGSIINNYELSLKRCKTAISDLKTKLSNLNNIYKTEVLPFEKELHYANAILEGVNTLKDIKKLLTKNE